MRIIFGICSWGLGHATRSLPIIRKFIREKDEVTIVSYGSALSLLRNELGESAEFVELPDYRPPTTRNSRRLALDTLLSCPQYLYAMQREHRYLERLSLDGKVDIVFSDSRYGFYSLHVPSFFMTHQLRFMNPLFLRTLESGSEIFNRWFLDRSAGVLVPDFKENGLAGRLAHGLSVIDEEKLNYIGVLSDFGRRQTPQDIDVFVSISGVEPHRSSFERLVMEQLESIDGNVVVSLGIPAANEVIGNAKVQGLSPRATQEGLLNRARVVVARAGYSTLMDICALGKKSLLIPTPGQTEQEYLAAYHMSRGDYYCVSESELDIPRQLDAVLSRDPPTLQHSTERAVENAIGVMTGTARLD
jgi:UDP-N-acetylglucosamine transferase subunit ALG13